jgi:HEXXH motif-containing protein
LIATHSLPSDAFIALATGVGDSRVVRHLREAQHSKHLMLLHAMARTADGAEPSSPALAAFRAGYRLLVQVQACDRDAVTQLLGLPHIGSWAHDCLKCLDQGSPPDFGYLACAAAAVAVRLGVPFGLDIPVRNGRIVLPGLGSLDVGGRHAWMRVYSNGEHVAVGEDINLPCAALVPDDGSGEPVPHWRGTPLIRATAEGHSWTVLLESADHYLDRYTLPMLAVVKADEVANWRHRIQSAWQLLVQHHGWAAGPIADSIQVIVPLTPRSNHDSATTPAAFGAIATSLPRSAVVMAETLVHEFQHLKLCGLMDMLSLVETSSNTLYAPWRDDPRPAAGLLQGVYAFLGIVRFWNAQRYAETEPDDIFHAQAMYERWRPTIELATSTLLSTGALTSTGMQFVNILREQGQRLDVGSVPPVAKEIAREITLDHSLTWQFRHMAFDAATVASLVAAYQHGEALSGHVLPDSRIETDTRKVHSTIRSRLLNMRCLEPRRYWQLSAENTTELNEADRLLICGSASKAVQAYRNIIVGSDPQPDAWIGLTLAIHRLPATPLHEIFATRLPLLFEMHACLADQGIRTDPLELSAWFV